MPGRLDPTSSGSNSTEQPLVGGTDSAHRDLPCNAVDIVGCTGVLPAKLSTENTKDGGLPRVPATASVQQASPRQRGAPLRQETEAGRASSPKRSLEQIIADCDPTCTLVEVVEERKQLAAKKQAEDTRQKMVAEEEKAKAEEKDKAESQERKKTEVGFLGRLGSHVALRPSPPQVLLSLLLLCFVS